MKYAVTIGTDTAQVGDDVLIRMETGPQWRVGKVIALATDLLWDEPVVELDDHKGPIHVRDIRHMSILTDDDDGE